MSPTTTKTAAIIEAISQDIAEREKVAEKAMLVLEQMSTSAENYKDACLRFGLNCFVACYLKHIKDAVENSDLETAENLIRFHAYYQHKIGNLTDGSNISTGQATVAMYLDSYIERFFDAES